MSLDAGTGVPDPGFVPPPGSDFKKTGNAHSESAKQSRLRVAHGRALCGSRRLSVCQFKFWADAEPPAACSSSSSACSGMSPGSTHIATTDVSVGDWTQYPVCVRTKVCKLKEGQKWTKELLQQRLDILRRVRWCLCCGEVCQVRSNRNAKWSDAEIIGDCHRKNTIKITMAVHIPNATKQECGKV